MGAKVLCAVYKYIAPVACSTWKMADSLKQGLYNFKFKSVPISTLDLIIVHSQVYFVYSPVASWW